MYGDVHEDVMIALPVKVATGPPLVVVKADATLVTVDVDDITVPGPLVPVEPLPAYDRLEPSGEQPTKSGMLTL